MDCLMGVDLGSTNLKAVIYDLAGRAVAKGSRPTERCQPSSEHPEWVVWQPDQIWGGTAAAIRDALASLDDPRSVKGIAVTGMGMDGVPIDEAGRWLYPFISWHDPRTAEQYAWWAEHIGIERTFAIGGNPVWPINSALRILWMAQHEPAILAQADKWLLIEDFLNFMLCGRRATDHSMASCTMLFDQRSLSWSEELIEASGIDRRLLCEVLPSGTVLGGVSRSAAEITGLLEGTPVVLGGHAHLCGMLPIGAFQTGVALDITGTWESVLASIDSPVLDPEWQKSGLTVQAHVVRGKYAVWGGNVAGDMLEWFRQQFGQEAARTAAASGESVWDCLMEAASAAPPGARRAIFLPHFSGASCPMVDARSLGALVGLSNTVTSGDILRAIIEGINYQLLDVIATVEAGLGRPFERLIVAGGGTRNTFWMQNKADVLGRPVEASELEEATPLGAAILAGIGLGLYQDERDAYRRIARPGRIYQPDPERAAFYAKRFPLYRQLYPALREIHHALH